MSERPVDYAVDVTVEVHTHDKALLNDLFGPDVAVGSAVAFPSGCQGRYLGKTIRIGAWPGLPEILQVGITLGTGVTTSLLATWLYNKFKGRVSEVRFNRKVVEITPDGFKKVIEESLKTKS